jgi:aminomethyltransferase
MRVSPLKNKFASMGASFENRYGVEVATRVNDTAKEYNFVRDASAVTDFSYMQKFRVPEETGLDFLDGLLAGNVAKIRFGRVLHTFLTDDSGMLLADCYVANNDDEFIVLCESIADDNKIREIFTSDTSAGVEDITEKTVVIGVDGYKAWAVIKELFGADILGLPYMSIETYQFKDQDIRLLRAGKTSEFGYLLIAPADLAETLFDTLNEQAKTQSGGVCSVSIHNDLRLEGRFFNIFAEGAKVKDPLALGLQWMIDFDKEQFTGHDAIMDRRNTGIENKIIGVKVDNGVALSVGSVVYCGNRKVATVQAVCFSYVLDATLGLALFDKDVAFSGLQFTIDSSDGPSLQTISMPPIMPKSLSVKLDEI